jgi:5'-methylthioadenosine phosphorylase
MHRSWGADIVGMTLVPECVLAREAEICYSCVATVTDYDVWKDEPVNAQKVKATISKNLEKVKKILVEAVSRIPEKRGCECGSALKCALV